jgi:MoxR-like ATPase
MIRPRSERPPIIIATSNEERRLPDAFLRRCIFHRIELTPALVEAAVESMARGAAGDLDGTSAGAGFPNLDRAARDAARKRFWEIRALPGIDKKPSTAELLTWLCILSAQRVDAPTLERRGLRDLPGIEALIKDYEDLRRLG